MLMFTLSQAGIMALRRMWDGPVLDTVRKLSFADDTQSANASNFQSPETFSPDKHGTQIASNHEAVWPRTGVRSQVGVGVCVHEHARNDAVMLHLNEMDKLMMTITIGLDSRGKQIGTKFSGWCEASQS